MIAHILRHTGYGCNAFLGGIASNYNTNFWTSEKNVCVAEADEYDRSFLKLSPDIAVVTAMDPDHLDIYGTAEEFKTAFIAFTRKVKSGGLLVVKHGLLNKEDYENTRLATYSLEDDAADAYAKNIRIDSGAYRFDVCIGKETIADFKLNMGGLHNIENAIAAILSVRQLGIEDEFIKEAVAAFKGVKRRFEYIIKTENLVMIDDYAHHPQELEALIDSVKGLFPQKRCTMVFQPHLYSRTRDFAEGFSNVLKKNDKLFLLPIYPARELPIEGVSSEMLVQDSLKDKATYVSKEAFLDALKKEQNPELLIMAGAGDIDAMVEPVKQILMSKA
jgi:UDP-N-acetylmuramate--alanine ligase